MSKDIKVIEAFKLPISTNEINELKVNHTYISDKLILDAINGVGVVAKDLHNVNKQRQSLIYRSLDGINGSSRKRQDLINENLIEGLHACTEWLKDHDRHFARIDTKIFHLANELIRTQDEILEFYRQHTNLRLKVDELKDELQSFKQYSKSRMNELNQNIKSVDKRDRAYLSIDREFSFLSSGEKYKSFDITLKMYSLLDNLKSGDVGIYFNSIENNEQNELMRYIRSEFKNYLKDEIGGNYSNEFIELKSLYKNINTLSTLDKTGISIVTTQHYNFMLEQNQNPEICDLLSLVSTYSEDEALQEISKQSNISNFITYNDFVEIATKEHLKG